MRYAISYCEMRVVISGSPTSRNFISLSLAKSSSNPRRTSRLTPFGLDRYSTGSPTVRNFTPCSRDGKKPEP